MTSKQKKEFLSQYIEIKKEIELLETMREKLYCIKSNRITQMPRSESDIHDRLAENICDTIQKENKYIQKIVQDLQETKEKILECISSIKSSKHRALLYQVYIEGRTLSNISVYDNYDYKYVCKLHGQALSQIKI